MSEEDKFFLICALADCEFTIPGSSFEHRCAKCNRRVMMAPSGQRQLLEHPAAMIVCLDCYDGEFGNIEEVMLSSGPSDERHAEVEAAVPNPWRQRN